MLLPHCSSLCIFRMQEKLFFPWQCFSFSTTRVGRGVAHQVDNLSPIFLKWPSNRYALHLITEYFAVVLRSWTIVFGENIKIKLLQKIAHSTRKYSRLWYPVNLTRENINIFTTAPICLFITKQSNSRSWQIRYVVCHCTYSLLTAFGAQGMKTIRG